MSWTPFLFLLLFFLMSFGFGYLYARHTLGSKPALRNLICASIFILGCMLIFIVINVGMPKSWEIRPANLSTFLGVALIWSIYFRWFWLAKRAGKTLLNPKRLKFDKWSLVLGTGGVFIGLLGIIQYLIPNENASESIENIVFLFIGIVMLISGLMGTKILEKGITTSGRFMAWDKIKSYEWESDRENTLTVKLKNRFPLFQTLSLPIQPHNKEEVDKFLKENISGMA